MSLTAVLLVSAGIGAAGGLAAAAVWRALGRAQHWSELVVVAVFNGCGLFFLSVLVLSLLTQG